MGKKDGTRIYLMRHGEVENPHPKRYNGHRDVGLSPNGFAQMEKMVERLREHPITAVYSSDLQRTVKGAEILSKAKGLSFEKRPLLREKNFGAWEGLTYEEAEAQDPEEWSQWLEDPCASRPPQGETFQEVEARVMEELSKILEKHRGEEVLIVAHGGVNRVILCDALQLDIKHIFRIEQRFSALNIIDYFSNDMASVHLMNA